MALRLELRWRIVGSGEAELLNEGAADADQEEAERKQPEARLKQRCGGDRPAHSGDDRAGHEAAAQTGIAQHRRSRQCAERHADIERGDRQGRERLVLAEKLCTD